MDDTLKRQVFDVVAWAVGLVTVMVLVAHEAMADGNLAPPPNARWQAECGSCHIAYPPRLLSAPAWRRLMTGLSRHFGSDASLDATAAAEISAFLEQHAATGRRARDAADVLRITETGWFQREHREVSAASWKHPDVKSPANCAACHTLAAQGDFRERNIRVPR